MTSLASRPAAAFRRTRRRALLAILLTLAIWGHAGSSWGAPVRPADHARCLPWRGILLALGGGALAGWALMRLGQRPPPQ